METFHDFVAAHVPSYNHKRPWIQVGWPKQRQGWKLHLSSIPVLSADLLRTVCPLLVSNGVAWKCLESRSHLGQINDGSLGQTQIGKFITVYLDDVDQAQPMIAELVDATKGFKGPRIPTDIRIADVVYARYGCFVPSYDRLGARQRTIVIEGRECQDVYTIPPKPPAGITIPFPVIDQQQETRPFFESALAGRYVVTDVLRPAAKGSVYRGFSIVEDAVAPVIIKEGRAHCCSDDHGRDIRDRLRHQFALCRKLTDGLAARTKSPLRVPAVLDLIEREEEAYLITEYVSAQPLAALSGCSLETAAMLAEAVRSLHELGIVHRDLSPKNVLLDGETVTIIDWELAAEIGTAEQPYELGTPGFMSRDQARGAAPSFGDDIFAFGALIVYLITGTGADRFDDVPDLHATMKFMAPDADDRVIDAALRCIGARGQEETPNSMEMVTELLRNSARANLAASIAAVDLAAQIRAELPRMVAGIFECPGHEQGHWYSASLEDARQLELRKDLHHGNAGILLALTGMPTELLDDNQRERMVRVADWLALQDIHSDNIGLYFGRSGRALALAAMSRSQDDKAAGWRSAAARMMTGTPDWLDITHGAAGHGIAALLCHEITRDPSLLNHADAAAEYLLAAQAADGSWALPAGVHGFEGKVFYGFGHGVAGIAYFLLVYAHQQSNDRAFAAFERAAEYLQSISVRTGATVTWPWGKDDPQMWNWWCHGALGISLLFTKAFEITRRDTYRQVAREALASFPFSRRENNLGLCHGLTGYGQALLCANAVDPSDWYESRLAEVAATVWYSRQEFDNVIYWKTNGPSARPTADLMTGTTGIVDFLNQYANGRYGFPGLAIRPIPA